MKRTLTSIALCVALAVPCAAAAQTPPAAAPQSANQYNDPAVSFTAPAGFIAVRMPPHDPGDYQERTMVAAFVKNPGQPDQQTITISVENFDNTLDAFEVLTENELRGETDGLFVKKKERTALSNGMPAYWQEMSVGAGFDEVKRFGYVWVDGVRGLSLSISAGYGHIDEPTAKQDLANVSAVRYPNRPY